MAKKRSPSREKENFWPEKTTEVVFLQKDDFKKATEVVFFTTSVEFCFEVEILYIQGVFWNTFY